MGKLVQVGFDRVNVDTFTGDAIIAQKPITSNYTIQFEYLNIEHALKMIKLFKQTK